MERSFHFGQKYYKDVSKNKPFCENAVLKLLAPYYVWAPAKTIFCDIKPLLTFLCLVLY